MLRYLNHIVLLAGQEKGIPKRESKLYFLVSVLALPN